MMEMYTAFPILFFGERKMDYSVINKLLSKNYTKDEFVIGGLMAVAMSEPLAAKILNYATPVIYVTATRFNEFKALDRTVTLGPNEIRVYLDREGVTVRLGIPYCWADEHGYQVLDTLPLRRWLEKHGHESLLKYVHDVPFPTRLAKMEKTEELIAFEEDCKKHDWYSDFSDSSRVRSNGSKSLKVLQARRDELGENAKDIFLYYSTK